MEARPPRKPSLRGIAGGDKGQHNGVFIRGANWNNGSNAGAFTLNLNWGTGNTNNNVGFRCARYSLLPWPERSVHGRKPACQSLNFVWRHALFVQVLPRI